jgi:radical SAM protein (TIGR01212 family)
MRNEKRYNTFGRYLRERFGRRVWKVTVDAGMDCPNCDGTLGVGGCAYCLRRAHSPGGVPGLSAGEQISRGIERLRRLRSAESFMVYFQAGTNTYAPLGELKSLFDTIRAFDDVVALAVGTRPDCLGEGVLDLLASYHPEYEVWLELGLQSAHDRTLRAINRGHDLQAFLDAWTEARRRPLKLCVHLILGLPGESREDILDTIRMVADLGPDGIKLHPLQVLRGTPLAAGYERGEFRILSLGEYAALACDSLLLLPPETTIQRLTAEAPRSLLVAPDWCADKQAVLAAVETELARLRSRQGDMFAGGRRPDPVGHCP